MEHVSGRATLVRGADGQLYEINADACVAVSEAPAVTAAFGGVAAGSQASGDYASGRMMIEAGEDYASGRMMIEPSDDFSPAHLAMVPEMFASWRPSFTVDPSRV